MTADVDSSRLGRAHSGSERCGIQRGEHSSGILVDHSQQSASRGFWGPPPAFPVLDSVKAEPKHARKFRLCHTKSIADRLHVNLLGHVRFESLLLPSKESFHVVKAIHHLLELGLHATSRRSRKYCRHVSSACCVPPWIGFPSHSSEKP